MTEETVLPRSGRAQGTASMIALVGFMGAGKTTVGQAVAARLDWRFTDLDQLIEVCEGRTVPQIFDQNGEARFRALEREVLEKTLADRNSRFLVLALGGGAFVAERVRGLLREYRVPTVWLDAPAEELFRRCDQPGVVRPLRREPAHFAALYEQRLSSYRQADFRVLTQGKEIPAVAEEIIMRLALQPASRSAE